MRALVAGPRLRRFPVCACSVPGNFLHLTVLVNQGAADAKAIFERLVLVFRRFLRKREILAPTLQGWAVILLCLLIVLTTVVTGLHPFLAVNRPVGGEVLVVEGWLSKYALQAAADRFRSDGYRWLVTTGGPLSEDSHFAECFAGFQTYADVSAALLKEMGVEGDRISTVATPRVVRNRTYASAVALRRYLQEAVPTATGVDVFTLGPHARRTWLLFDMALGGQVRVGVIHAAYRGYDPHRWWASSSGVKRTITEALGYLYARFLFFPEE